MPIGVSTAVLKDAEGVVLGGVETFRDQSLLEELRRELNTIREHGSIISQSSAMERILGILPQVAKSDSTVLIEGETGTGKEMMARELHRLSHRSEKPFIAVNCGALPDNLLESELFGYKAGAFTGAVKDKPGLFAAAKGGTILLDELGEISPSFQVKLLRVLEERQYLPLGGVVPQALDARILAATNANLEQMVEDDRFRRDLFYRINVIRFFLPPLEQRREDIPLLIAHFVKKMNLRFGKEIVGLTREAMELLLTCSYPGNIRELENIIEHGFVLCNDSEIDIAHLPASLNRDTPVVSKSIPGAVDNSEAAAIIAALERCGGNRQQAATALGMHRTTLFRKIKKYGIAVPERDGRHIAGKKW